MSGAELLDVLTADGAPLLGSGGEPVRRPREQVHREGDWHAAFHLWVTSPRGVLLQRRSLAKRAWPGALDATAAGHLCAGEAVLDGLREAEEELGVRYAPHELASLGVHRVDERAGEGVNREHQHVFAVRDERPLEAYAAIDLGELDGLVLVAHDAFAHLVTDRRGEYPAIGWNGVERSLFRVRASEMVPAPYRRELAPALRSLAGEP